jgi:hypothetical protein
MFAGNDITVGTWIDIDDGCAIFYQVYPEMVEFSLGERISRFQLNFTETGLRTMLDVGAAALAELSAWSTNDDEDAEHDIEHIG